MKMLIVTYTEDYIEKKKTKSDVIDGTKYETNNDGDLLIFASDGSIVRKFEYDEWLSVSPIS